MNPNIYQSITVLPSDAIREILAKRIDQQKQAVGIVVGIIEPTGRRVVAHGQLANGDPRTPDGDTIFEIGSITKIFTSLVLADMVSRNEVALDDPASKYLPENVKMPERSGKSITLLDLSTHSSGLPPLPSNLKMKNPRNPYADYSVDDLYQFLSGYELPRDPGSEVQYSNLGAGLLGHVLACRAGMDYESMIATRITRPLGMPDTGITLSSSMQQRMATGHTAMLVPTTNWDFPSLAGAGSLRSSANDMLTFLEGFLGYKDPALAPAMNTMLDVRRPVGKASIALGWFIFPTDGREIANHDGGTGGFCSFVGFDPKERIGVVVLSNAFTRVGVVDIGIHLLNPKAPLANPEPPKQRTEVPIDPEILDRYTGSYQLGQGVLEITCESGGLYARVTSQSIAGPKFQLFAESEKKFFARVTDSQITFETGSEGRATNLILHKAGRNMPAPRLF